MEQEIRIATIEIYGRFVDVASDGRCWRHGFIDTLGRNRPSKPIKFTLSSNGYLRANMTAYGKVLMVTSHELVALAFIGPRPDGTDVHHIDGDKINNDPVNLKYIDHGTHACDHRHGETGGTSKRFGVSWCSRSARWRAQARVGGKGKHLGYFATEIEAAQAFNEFAIKNGYASKYLNDIPKISKQIQ